MDLSTLMPQQRDIVTTLDRPLFVSAGAGSGKTFTLTRRILWALSPESGPFADSLDQVLAITFTKDAAAEIRERVRAALVEAGMEEEALAVDDAWISTIHGMCSRILRAHALELGIDPEFEVAEEPVAGRLRNEAVEWCIARLRGRGANADGDGDAAAYGLDPAAFGELLAWYPLTAEVGPAGASGVSVSSIVARLLELSCSLPDGMDGVSFATGALDLSSLMDAYRPLLDVSGKGPEIAQRALDAVDRFFESDQTWGDLCALLLACEIPRPSKAFPKEQVALLRAEIADAFTNAALACGGAALDQLKALAKAVEKRYRALKAERALLDNGDLLRLTYEALRSNETLRAAYADRFKLVMIDEFQDTDQQQVDLISFLTGEGGRALCTVGDAQQSIYRFRGAEVEVFRRQERKLAEAAASAEAGAGAGAGTDSDGASGAAAGAVASVAPKRVELVRNFRSHAEVLRYVARVFDDAQGGLMPGFLDLEAHEGRKSSLVAERASRSQAFLVAGGTTEERTQAKAAAIAEHFAALAREGQSAGSMVLLLGGMPCANVYADAIRAVGLDCVISGGSIFATTEEARTVRALACALANPADTAQGLMPLLASPAFALGAEELLSLCTRFDEETGETFRRNLDRGILAREDPPGLECLPLVERAREILKPALARVGVDSFSQIARDVVNESGWLVRLERAGAEGRAKAANVLKALDALDEAEDRMGNAPRAITLAYDGFLEGKEAPGALNEGEAGAVRIMTVHSSKGLEFPVVAVAECFDIRANSSKFQTRRSGRTVEAVALPARFADARTSGGELVKGKDVEKQFKKFFTAQGVMPAWLDPAFVDDVCATGSAAEAYISMREESQRLDLEERARLLYVAMTRAREAVILAMDAKVGTGAAHDLKFDASRDLTEPVLRRILPAGETELDLNVDRLVFDNAQSGDFELIALSDFGFGGVSYRATAELRDGRLQRFDAPSGDESAGAAARGCEGAPTVSTCADGNVAGASACSGRCGEGGSEGAISGDAGATGAATGDGADAPAEAAFGARAAGAAPGPADPELDTFLLVRPARLNVRAMPASAPKRDSYSYSSMARALHEEEDERELSRAQAHVAAGELSASDGEDGSAAAGALEAAVLDGDPDALASAIGHVAAQVANGSGASEASAVEQPVGVSSSLADSAASAIATARPAGAPTADAGDATALGSAFHAAAQWLIESGAEEVPPARRAALARYWHLTESQVERLDAALDRWEVSSVRAELNGWPLVRAEVPFFSLGLDDAKVRERFGAYAEGAIDALATDPADPSRALVIDYKTGGSAAETPEELQRKHALQARVYADVLHKAGFCTVELKFVRVEREDEQAPGEPQVVSYRLEAGSGTESATMPAM